MRIPLWRARERFVARQPGEGAIVAEAQLRAGGIVIAGEAERLDTSDIDRVELLDVAEHLRELGGEFLFLRFREREASKLCSTCRTCARSMAMETSFAFAAKVPRL